MTENKVTVQGRWENWRWLSLSEEASWGPPFPLAQEHAMLSVAGQSHTG